MLTIGQDPPSSLISSRMAPSNFKASSSTLCHSQALSFSDLAFCLLLLHLLPWTKEKAMAPHSSTLAWKILWMEEPGRLQSMGLLRVGHDWETSLSPFTSCTGEGNGNLLQCSCLENPRDGRAWWAAVSGVAQSQTWLKWLSTSSSHELETFFYFKGPMWLD